MGKIKKYLREIEITQKELAYKLNLSRPTLDTYIEMYESGKPLPKDKYQIVFDNLFREKMPKSQFVEELKEFSYLLKRDSKYGISDFSAEASDVVIEIFENMKEDMKDGTWEEDMYIFINSCIRSYREYHPIYYLAKYFIYLNTARSLDEIQPEEIPYLANYHKIINLLEREDLTYDNRDYRAFLDACERNRSDREAKRNEKANNIQELIRAQLLELENKGIEASEAEIVDMISKKLLNELKEKK